MFIGHFGIGFAAKKAAPGLSLGLLFIASQFLDLLWPVLLLLDLEHAEIVPGITKLTPFDFTNYPISHSLMMVLFWCALGGIIYWIIKKNNRQATVVALCIMSHWILDLIVHRPDLPIYPGNSFKAGFGLWNYPVLSILVEGLIFITGLVFYIRQTKSLNKSGTYGLWILVFLLVAIHTGNMLGPPPPDMKMVAWAGNLQWLFVFLAFWVDRNREYKPRH